MPQLIDDSQVIVVLDPGADPLVAATEMGASVTHVYHRVFTGFAGTVPPEALSTARTLPTVQGIFEDGCLVGVDTEVDQRLELPIAAFGGKGAFAKEIQAAVLDGRADIAVFRPSDGKWYSNAFAPTTWGQSGDIPVPADYDGDGRADIAVFRPSQGRWYSNVFPVTTWGQNGDVPVPADYNGDGRDDIAVFRPSDGKWYSNVFAPITFGQNGDIPVPADYNGDGRADILAFTRGTPAQSDVWVATSTASAFGPSAKWR